MQVTFTTVTDEARWKGRSLKALVGQIEEKILNIPSPEDKEEWTRLWGPWKLINTKDSAFAFLEKMSQNDMT